MIKQLLFMMLIISNYCTAQFNGARNEALGNTYTTQKDILSASNNIAKLSDLHSINIAIATKNGLFMKELQQSKVVIGIPFKKGFGAFSIYHFGFQLYRETHISFAFALALSPSFSIGLKFNYNFIFIKELNRKKGSIYPDLGLNYTLNKNVELALVLTNLTLSKISDNSSLIWPSTFNLGLKYTVNPQLKMFLESLLSIQSKMGLKYGLEYQIHSMLSLLFGIKSYPSTLSMGVSINLKNLQIDIASSYQSFLGFSPSLSIRFEAFN